MQCNVSGDADAKVELGGSLHNGIFPNTGDVFLNR